MTTYYIYNIANDEYLGEVKASSVEEAEIKAIKELKITIRSDYVAAFTEKILDMAGKYDFDEDAIRNSRMESMI